VLHALQLLQLRHLHRAARAFEQLLGGAAALAQPREFAEAHLEDAAHAGAAALCFEIAVQRAQVATGPEGSLEVIGLGAGPGEHRALGQDDGP
jgi:hypothetical protein